MNALPVGRIVRGGADAAARWARAFDRPAVLAGQMARDLHPVTPAANAPRIGGSILVGHSCPLVEMGLLATLRRLTLHDVATLDELSTLPPGELGARSIDIVVADRVLAGSLARFASNLHRSHGRTAPKILLIGADDASSSPVRRDADLTLQCRQRDLLDAVNALLGSGAREMLALVPKISARDSTGLPARSGNDLPGARSAPSAGNGVARGIEVKAPQGQEANTRPRGGLPPGALRRVREAMEQRLAENIELTELAAVAGVSRCHFARAFKESVGQPPHRYLMMRRVEGAVALIKETDRSLTDISIDMGFFDQSHFTRVFSRIVGETPSAYRRRHR